MGETTTVAIPRALAERMDRRRDDTGFEKSRSEQARRLLHQALKRDALTERGREAEAANEQWRRDSALATIGPHGAITVHAVTEDGPRGNRVFTVVDDEGGEIALTGEELAALAAWAAEVGL